MTVSLVLLAPLEGFVVGVTADRRAAEQAELLGRRGASVLHGPTMDTQYLGPEEDLWQATQAVMAAPPDYVVACTGIGMRAWLEVATAAGSDGDLVAMLGRARIVVRGPKAASAVQAVGLPVWGRSPTEEMDGLLDLLLAEPLAGARVVIQEDGVPRPAFAASIEAAGATVVRVPVYRWRVPEDTGPALRLVEAVCERRVDAVTFTSAPAVHNLFAIAETHGRAAEVRQSFNGGVAAACIGPVCARGAEEEGIDAPIAPDLGRLGLLVRALSDHCQGARRRTLHLAGHDVVVQGSVVAVEGTKVELTPKERAVLDTLAERPGVVVSRTTLLARGWGSPTADPHLLEVTVGRLRRRLGPCGTAIACSPRRGYRLVLGTAAES